MLINSSDFRSMPGITNAVLNRSADGACVLTLSWRGYGPAWLNWMEPVTIMHRGSVLFHGRLLASPRSNAAGSLETSATVTDALWLLDHLPLGAQVAEAIAASETSAADFRKAGQAALASWDALADSCRVNAPLWTVDAEGVPQESGIITLDTSRANFSTGAVFDRDKPMTAWTALLEMRQANPDSCFLFDPITGKVNVVAISKADTVVWDMDGMEIEACTDIGPQYEACITGVALVVSWQATENTKGGSVLHVYPDTVEPGDMGVKVFTASVESRAQAERQAAYMMQQLARYYEAVNVLQHGGSVTAVMDDVPACPLCHRMNITGTGTHESWHDMATMVTATTWDFLAGTVEAQLGAQIAEPDISEMTFPEDEEDSSSDMSSTDEDGGGDDDFSSREDSEEEPAEDDSTTWDYTTTWGESTTWEYTTTWEESTTWSDTATWEESTTWEYSSTTTASASTTGTGTTGSSGSSYTPPSTAGSEQGSSTGTTGSGSQGSSTGTTGSGSQGSSTGTHPGESGTCCPSCAERWAQYEHERDEILRRLKALEDGECTCVQQVQEAIEAVLAGTPPQLGGTATSEVQGNANGTIHVTTSWSYQG